jgi:hypothetical protein
MVTMTVAYWDFVPITAAGQRGHFTPLPSAHPFGYQPTNRAPGLCQDPRKRRKSGRQEVKKIGKLEGVWQQKLH